MIQNRLHKLLIAVLGVIAALSLNFGLSSQSAVAQTDVTSTPFPFELPPRTNGDEISIQKSITPGFIVAGGSADVVIILMGAGLEECTGAPIIPVDMIFVADISDSANKGTPVTNWNKTSAFINSLLVQIQQPVYRNLTSHAEFSQVGFVTSKVVGGKSEAVIVQGLTRDYGTASAAIAEIRPQGDTDIAVGVDNAADIFTEQSADRARAIVLLLHDNVPLKKSAIAAINEVRGRGIAIFVVINSLGIPDEDLITHEMVTQFADADHVFFDPQPEELRRLFVAAAEGNPETLARDFHLVEEFSPPDFVEISDVQGPGGRTEGDKVVWDIPRIGLGDTIALSYRIGLHPGALANIQVRQGAARIDCNGYLHNNISGETVDVALEPTATPWIIPQTTPTPTPAIAATFTPGPSPTPIPSGPLPAPTNPLFCTSAFWWIPALLLPLLLVLLLILLMWWWSRRAGFNWPYEWGQSKWKCRIPFLLLFLYLLFLTFLVGRELTIGLCKSREAVYFWRMDGLSEGIYLTVPQSGPAASPVPFKEVNNRGCVGCHAVSPKGGMIAVVDNPSSGGGFLTTLTGKNITTPSIDPIYWGWAPDGSKAAFSNAAGDVYILNLVTNAVVPLLGASDPNVIEVMPTWSADGETIAFARSTTPINYGFELLGSSDIYTVPAQGGVAQPLLGASGSGFNYYPAYSPDGKWLAFTHHSTGSSSYAAPEAEIYIVPATGGVAKRIAANDGPNGEPLVNVSNSWPTWSRDGALLAFNSKRFDPKFDIFATAIDAEGNSGPALPLDGASTPGVFEHLPYWGEPIQPLPLWQRLLNLWPWLLPIIPLFLLALLLCRKVIPEIPQRWEPKPRKAPGPLPTWIPDIVWDPKPAFIIGLGGTGRWVLTHLKRNLLEAGAGKSPEQVRLLLIDTSEDEWIGDKRMPVEFAGTALRPEEKLVVGENLIQLNEAMANEPGIEPEIEKWYPARDYHTHLPASDFDLARGTHQHRPAGRAGLFHHLQKGGRHSELYRRLIENLIASKEEFEGTERTQIIIVGSTCGGLGSSILADTAHLVRKAAVDAGIKGSTNIEAYLVTEGAYHSIQQAHSERSKVNAFATLREIARFQLGRGRPYPMIYKCESSDPILNDYCTKGLLDSVYLFDGAPFLVGERPEDGICPAIADILTMLLDRASYSSDKSPQKFRDSARNTIAEAQARRGELMAGAGGIFTYRLPWLHIFENLKVRFALDLLSTYLVGPGAQQGSIQLTPQQNREAGWQDDLHKEVMRVLGIYWVLALVGTHPSVIGGILGSLIGLLIGVVLTIVLGTLWWLFFAILIGIVIGAVIGAWRHKRTYAPTETLAFSLPEGAPEETATIAAIAHSTRAEDIHNIIFSRISKDMVENPDSFRESRRNAFRQYLLSVVAFILNGRSESQVIDARTGKIGYALEFLEEMRAMLNAGKMRLQTTGETSGERSGVESLQNIAADAILIVEEVKNNLMQQVEALAGQQDEKGVYYHLLMRERELKAQRQQMEGIHTRKYLWKRRAVQEGRMKDEELSDNYYRDYLADRIAPSLEQFHWHIMEKDGQSTLKLCLHLDEPISFNIHEPVVFAEALQTLGQTCAKEIWRIKHSALEAVVDETLLTEDHINSTTENLCDRAVPLVLHDPKQADQPLPEAIALNPSLYQACAFLAANQNVSKQTRLVDLLRQRLEGLPVETLTTTDPFTLSMMQMREVVPLSAFSGYHDCGNAYRVYYGIAERGRSAAELGWREPVHVFPAERGALAFEQRLPEIGEVRFACHPLFATALEELDPYFSPGLNVLDRSRLFPLALLAGYLRKEKIKDRYRYRLCIPGTDVDIPLALPEDITKPEAQMTIAMRTFVLGTTASETESSMVGAARESVSQDPLPGPIEVQKLAEQVRKALQRDSKALMEKMKALEEARIISHLEAQREAIRRALPVYLLDEETRPCFREMRAFLRLVVKDEYRALLVAQNKG